MKQSNIVTCEKLDFLVSNSSQAHINLIINVVIDEIVGRISKAEMTRTAVTPHAHMPYRLLR